MAELSPKNKLKQHKYKLNNPMTLKEIFEDSVDGDLLPSVTGVEVTKVGPIKEGSGGQYQFIYVENKTSEETVKLIMKDERFFLKEEHVGCELEIIAGPPVKNKPQGIIFDLSKDGDPRIKIMPEAGVMKVITPITVSQPQLTEKAAEEPVAEKVEPEPVAKPGQLDREIAIYTRERLHIYGIVKETVAKYRPDYPMEKIPELATSIHIEINKSPSSRNKEILPPKESTARFKPEKGNNPEPKPAPKVKSLPEPKDDEPEQAEEQEDSAVIDIIGTYIESIKTKPYMKEKDAANTPLYESFRSQARRAKALCWFFSAPEKSISEKLRPVWNAIAKFIDETPLAERREICYEAMRFDQSTITKIPFEDSNFEKLDEGIVKILKIEKPAVLEAKTPPIDVVQAYFYVDKEDRVP